MKQNAQSGQIGLVVLLITAVLMTVGVGVASQSVFETKTSRVETESSQTFNVAEQGVEQALRDLTSIKDKPIQTITPNSAGITGQYLATAQPTFDTTLADGETGQIALTENNVPYTGKFTMTWTNSASCPGVVLSVVYMGGQIERYAFKNTDCANANLTGFTGVSCGGVGGNCSKQITLNGSYNAAFARVKVISGTSQITVGADDGKSLPTQSYKIDATATQNNQETRTLQVNKSIGALPSIFDYVLFSGSAL